MAKKGGSGKQKYPKKRGGKSFESIRTAGCPQTVQDKIRTALHKELDKEYREDRKAAVEEAFDDGIKIGQETKVSEGISAIVISVGKVANEAIATMERSALAIVEKASRRQVVQDTEPEEDTDSGDEKPQFERVPKDGGGWWLRRISEKIDTIKESEPVEETKHIAKHEGIHAIGSALGGPIGGLLGGILAPHITGGENHAEHMEEHTEAIHEETKAHNEKLDKLDEDVQDVKEAIVHQTTTEAASDAEFKEQSEDENKAVVKKLRDVDSSVDSVRRRLSFQSLMGFFGDVFGSVFSKIGGLFGGAGGFGGILKLLKGGGLVAGAGALGYGAGRLLDKGVEKLTGDTIGGNIYDMFNEDDDREKQALAYFKAKGWSDKQAAGIVANLQKESNLDPSAQGDKDRKGNYRAQGIGQWHPDRQADFEKKYKTPQLKGSSFEQQLDFVDNELRTTNKRAGDLLKGAKTAREAGEIISQHYERPKDDFGVKKWERGLQADKIWSQMQKVPDPSLAEPKEKDPVDYDKLANTIARAMPKPMAPQMPSGGQGMSTSASKMPVRPEDLGLAIANTGVFV